MILLLCRVFDNHLLIDLIVPVSKSVEIDSGERFVLLEDSSLRWCCYQRFFSNEQAIDERNDCEHHQRMKGKHLIEAVRAYVYH
jgi:hypothetical protein